MRAAKRWMCALPAVLLLFFLVNCISLRHAEAQSIAETASLAECVIEVRGRRFLHEKDADRPLPMASTTKILTAIILIEDCSPEEIVVIPAEAERAEGSSVYLRAGERYTVEELLYGLMLRSGNDCAVALAIHHSGSVKKFAATMNIRASQLGAERSRFANPHGLPEKDHYTTARDLALIASHAMENALFRSIVSCKSYPSLGWKNKNKILFDYEGACGVKTGFTREAGRCLVAAAERNNVLLVSVVLNSPQMYERSKELLDRAFLHEEVPIIP